MTCGVCHPKMFRENGGRVFGYMTADTPSHAVDTAKPLYFMGCEHIFCDLPIGHVRHRPAFKKLHRAVRHGDRIILPSLKVLGSTPATQQQRMAEFEAKGIGIFVLTDQPNRAGHSHLAIVA